MGAVYPVNYADAMVREVLERHQVPIACWSVSVTGDAPFSGLVGHPPSRDGITHAV